eukprot:2387839-Amphidinium_carterae.1
MVSGDPDHPVWDRDTWDPNFERSRSAHWQRPAGDHMSSHAMHHRSLGNPGRSSAGAGGRMDTSARGGGPCAFGNTHQPAVAGDMSAETARCPPHGDAESGGANMQSTRYPQKSGVRIGRYSVTNSLQRHLRISLLQTSYGIA